MGFRLSLIFTLFFMICDLFFLSIRVAFPHGVVAYILLALHESVLIILAILLISFIIRTCWVFIGPLWEALRVLRVVAPLWLLRIIFTFLPLLYREIVLTHHYNSSNSSSNNSSINELNKPRAWEDGGYGALFSINILIFILFHLALLHVISFLSEKSLYAPYCPIQTPATLTQQSSRGFSINSGRAINNNNTIIDSRSNNPLERRSWDEMTTSHVAGEISTPAIARFSTISERH